MGCISKVPTTEKGHGAVRPDHTDVPVRKQGQDPPPLTRKRAMRLGLPGAGPVVR